MQTRRSFFRLLGLAPLVAPAIVLKAPPRKLPAANNVVLTPGTGGAFIVEGANGKRFAFNDTDGTFEEVILDVPAAPTHLRLG